MRRRCLLLGLLALAGCSREPTPLGLTGEQLMVHSLLVAGSDTVQVLVTRALPVPEADPDVIGGYTFARPVSGAEVRLLVGGAAVRLEEAPEGFPPCFSPFPVRVPRVDSIRPGCYAAVVPGGIRAAERYGLEVRVNGATVEGETVVPRVPQIGTPEAGTHYPVAFGVQPTFEPVLVIPVQYSVPPEVAGVYVTLAVDSLFLDGQRVAGGTCETGAGSPRVLRTEPAGGVDVGLGPILCSRPDPERTRVLVTPDSVFARVLVAGFDSTYVAYAEAAGQASAERSRLRAGLEGALGVFAGAGVAATPVVLTRVPGTASMGVPP